MMSTRAPSQSRYGVVLLVGATTLLSAACAQASDGNLVVDPNAPINVVFLGHSAESGLGLEGTEALAWLRDQPGFATTYTQLVDLGGDRVPASSVLWWHYADSVAMPSAALQAATIAAVQAHVEAGGALLLSLLATPWLIPLGFETQGPDAVGFRPGTDWSRWGPEDDRVLAGFQSYRGHPLLRRFWGGVITAWMQHERNYASAVWTGDNWPRDGSVVAIGRRYIGLNPERRVVVEYVPDAARAGRVLAVGEGLYFADDANQNRVHLELFLEDALSYLAGRTPPAPAGARIASTGAPALPAESTMTDADPVVPEPPSPTEPATPSNENAADQLPGVLGATTYWQPLESGTRWFTPALSSASPVVLDPAPLESVLAARSGLALERETAVGEPFDLYSPRNLLTGRDTGRIEELWGYPLRLLRDLRFGIVDDNGTVAWLDESAKVRFTARPEGNSFRYTLDEVVIDLHLAVPRDHVGLVAVLAIDSPETLRIRAAWEVDHATMWPREAGHLGELQLAFSTSDAAIVWRDRADIMNAYAGFSQAVAAGNLGGRPIPSDAGVDSLTGDQASAEEKAPEPQRTVWLDTDVSAGEAVPLTFVIAARADDQTEARDEFRATLADPAAIWTANANYWREFLAKTVAIASPDPTLDEAFRWAKVGLEAFRMTTPGMGTGLGAGFASAKRAEDDSWAAENDFLRRPGYAWYFGRDSIWSAFAADAYGGSDLAEEALRFLARYQDVDGKILHELSPGWVAQYDAADSTPLFLLGLEHHIRTTGNRGLLRELWPSVRRAMDFLDTTDTDGDGLIENTNVGHGWIEGGKFYGAHTTLYLAGVWTATLEAVARMAEWVVDEDLRQSAAERAQVARQALNDGYWDPLDRRYRYGKRADGSYMDHRTILPAVPALLGVTDRNKTRPMIEMFGSAEITSDWGARMAPRSNPDYNPAGYHEGSVWPLYTGWTSLAAYGARQPLTGFLHAYSNLRLVRQGSLGYITEVLNGDVLEPIGVTDHQAWSHALTILPVIQGMLGIRPDAVNGVLRIHPQLPGGWRELTVQRVRVGDNAFNITVRREDETSAFLIERVAGNEAIQFDLALPFPRATLVNLDHDSTTGVAIPAGESIVNLPTEKQVRVLATLTETKGVIAFRHSPFPEVIQPLPAPAPGATSESLRILKSRFTAGALNVLVEGLPGRPYRFSIATPWPIRNIAGPRGSSVLNPGPGRALIEIVLPGVSSEYRRAALTVEFRR